MLETDIEKNKEVLSTSKTIGGIILAFVIFVIAQNLAMNLSLIPLEMGVPGALCNIILGILYAGLVYFGAKLLCEKFFHVSLKDFRIPRIGFKAVWVITAIAMPLLVVLLSVLAGGEWKFNSFSPDVTWAVVAGAIVFYGMATGIAEEILFRGLVMGCLEKKFGIRIAVIIPSVLFGLVHMIGRKMDFWSILQLIFAGSIVGILFSLVAYESKSVWNSVLIHSCWNMTIIGGILHIGKEADSASIVNFIFENKSFLLSGGDFGVEASVISIAVYLSFSVLALIFIRKNKTFYL